jgi:acyl-CoA synthetase (NDP forming)
MFLPTTTSPFWVASWAERIPAYLFPESAAKSIAGMYKYNQLRQRREGDIKKYEVDRTSAERIISAAIDAKREQLTPEDVRGVLEAYGFKFPRSEMAVDVNSAVEMAKEMGFPVVLKIVSPDIIHKSDTGGVALDLHDEDEVREAYKKILTQVKDIAGDVKIDGILVQEMVEGGKETIIGMSFDSNFGPLIMFGLGGIYVEVLKDVSFRIAPISDLDAQEMVRSVKSYPLLKGVRGEAPVDIQSIEDYIQRVSRLVEDFTEIVEIDINPLMAFEKGRCCNVVDARIRVDIS